MRLIDADKVVEYCCGYFGHCTQECIKCGFANSVKDIPTAYDVDKVCEELWNESRQNVGMDTRLSTIVAIDIVKRGGVDE